MCASDLIGVPYRYGATGGDAIDCIHLVLAVLDELQIPRPPASQHWYQASWRQVARELLSWGKRVDEAKLDGDVVLLSTDRHAFGVVWQQGVIHISEIRREAAWYPTAMFQPVHIVRHCSRLNAI
jgi:cell wall-associated NlpC family hydrolase